MSKKALIVNAVVVFALVFAAIFYIDGYVVHPIPGENAFIPISGSEVNGYDTDTRLQNFDVHTEGLGYEDAEIVDSIVGSDYRNIYLLKLNGELHLVDFEVHPLTLRSKLQADVLVDSLSCTVDFVGSRFEHRHVVITDGKITDSYGSFSPKSPWVLGSRYLLFYVIGAALITALETFLLSRCTKKQKKVTVRAASI